MEIQLYLYKSSFKESLQIDFFYHAFILYTYAEQLTVQISLKNISALTVERLQVLKTKIWAIRQTAIFWACFGV